MTDIAALFANPKVTSVALTSQQQALCPTSLSKYWAVWPVYYHHGLKGALKEVWVRTGVYAQLIKVADALPNGFRLVLLDGWRPMDIQNQLYEEIQTKIAKTYPHLDSTALAQMTGDFVAKASNDPVRPSPHLTGGAVDVTLADNDGRFLDMGSGFDEPSERSWTDYPVSGVAAENRKILQHAMAVGDFTNLPSEWWHYDYGNWLWATLLSKETALYGPTSLPESQPI